MSDDFYQNDPHGDDYVEHAIQQADDASGERWTNPPTAESAKAERIRATRDRELHRTYVPTLPPVFTTAVVGVSFTPSYPSNLYALEQAWLNAELLNEPLAAVIVRNPDNPHDENACEVHIPALGERAMVGHLTAPVAARLAPELDAGVRWHGEMVMVRIDLRHLERPGVDVRLERKGDG